MAVEIGGLVARFQADTTDLQRGAQEAKGALAGVGQQAQRTAQEIDATAARMAKSLGGTAAEWRDILGKTGFDKVGQDAQQAATAIDQVAAATQRAATATRAAQSARPSAAPVAPAAVTVASPAAARAQQATGGGADGFDGSSALRFAAGVAGVGLGLSIVTGIAEQIHAQIRQVVDDQLNWERSAKTLSGIYGDLGDHLQRVAESQASLPGALARQEVFAQTLISASDLRIRGTLDEAAIVRLSTAGDRAARAGGITDEHQQVALQRQIQQIVRSGGGSIPELGVFADPDIAARRLGYSGGQALQYGTPHEQASVTAALVLQDLNKFTEQANANQRAALEAVTNAQDAQNKARDALQTSLERSGVSAQFTPQQVGGGLLGMLAGGFGAPGGFDSGTAARVLADEQARQASAQQQANVVEAERNLATASDEYVKALADQTRQAEESKRAFEEFDRSVAGAGARLASLFGDPKDPNSIAHADQFAQLQGSVAARSLHAIPAIGMLQGDIVAGATNNAYQAAYQNFVADTFQEERRNAIREELQRRVQFGPGAQRPAAARALEQASASEPVYQRLGEVQRASALVDMRSAETQAGLEQISLTQRERYVQLLRETLELRVRDVQQQREGVVAQMDVIRAQQQGMGAQYSLADANYASARTQALARQYMGRSIRGQSVAGLPSIDDLIQQNVNSQFDIAERAPAALEAGHRVEMAQRTATAAGLGQQLTEGQVRYAELGNDLNNLKDLPSQTALMLESAQNERDQLAVAKESRELQKDLVKIFTGRGGPSQSGSSQALDELVNRVAQALLGNDDAGGNTAPPDLPGNRRGPS
jgi:hypothetical protein